MITYVRILVRQDTREPVQFICSPSPLADVKMATVFDLDQNGDEYEVPVVEWNGTIDAPEFIPAKQLKPEMVGRTVANLRQPPTLPAQSPLGRLENMKEYAQERVRDAWDKVVDPRKP